MILRLSWFIVKYHDYCKPALRLQQKHRVETETLWSNFENIIMHNIMQDVTLRENVLIVSQIVAH